MPRTSLAWRNIAHQPARSAVSVGGIAFAVLLMFMQLGFLGAVGDTATNVYRRVGGQILVRSPEYLHVYEPRTIDERVISRLVAMPEVASVWPLDLGLAKWQNPVNGHFRPVAVMGVDVDRNPLQLAGLSPLLPLLRRPDHVLVDRTSRRDYGPIDGVRFGDRDVGRTTDVMGRRVRIAGTFEMGTGLAANGAILVSRDGFRRIMPGRASDRVSLAIVKIRPPLSPQAAVERIRGRLARAGGSVAHASVMTMDEAVSREKRRWYLETPIGIIFAMGVGLAVVVGGVICYMVLASDVVSHLPEYATLKAMGYGSGYLGRTLWVQACTLAVISLPPATFAALLLYELTSAFAGVPVRMTWQWLVLVTFLTLVMCSVAGVVTVRKLSRAEPASLF